MQWWIKKGVPDISSLPFLVYHQLLPLRSKMLESIKKIDPSRIRDVEGLRAALTVLINAVEQLLQEKEVLKKENQQLRDENNKLKGGNARPIIKNPTKRDISSKGREKGNSKETHEDKNLVSPPIEIDSRLIVLP